MAVFRVGVRMKSENRLRGQVTLEKSPGWLASGGQPSSSKQSAPEATEEGELRSQQEGGSLRGSQPVVKQQRNSEPPVATGAAKESKVIDLMSDSDDE